METFQFMNVPMSDFTFVFTGFLISFFFQLCGQLLWLNIFQEENGDYNFEYDVL